MEQTLSPLQKIALAFVKFYRTFISPMLGQRCIFHPTCSQYAIDAIIMHGSAKGIWLTGKRLLRCHPLNEGGNDPVPAPNQKLKK